VIATTNGHGTFAVASPVVPPAEWSAPPLHEGFCEAPIGSGLEICAEPITREDGAGVICAGGCESPFVDWGGKREIAWSRRLLAKPGPAAPVVSVTPGIHSVASKNGVPTERILTFHTAREIAAAVVPEISWAIYPWAARGAILEVDGKIKAAGKTTWVSHAIRASLDGLPFMGYPTSKMGWGILTEQTPRTFREVLRRADLLDRDDLIVVYWHESKGIPWPVVVEQMAAECVKRGLGGLLVDTLNPFAGLKGDAENSAGAADEAMEPLKEAAAIHNLAIVVNRHERKGGGEVGDSGRGSSAFSGGVDVVVSLKRPEGNASPNVRHLHALSRFDETPDALVIELTEQGYVSLGSETAVASAKARDSLLKAAPEEEAKALTLEDLLSQCEGVKRTSATEAMLELVEAGHLIRVGAGKKGNPYRYWRGAQIHSVGTTSLGATETNSGPEEGEL
jgi:hypothetical protein